MSAKRTVSHVKLLMLLFESIKGSTFSIVFRISISAEIRVTFCLLHISAFCWVLKRMKCVYTGEFKWFIVMKIYLPTKSFGLN